MLILGCGVKRLARPMLIIGQVIAFVKQVAGGAFQIGGKYLLDIMG
jgi:hypothetical protein